MTGRAGENVSQRYRRRPQVIETDLGAELILLDPLTQEMFALNATGREVWRALDGRALDDIAARVVAAFDVTREVASADVLSLVHRLVDARLVDLAD